MSYDPQQFEHTRRLNPPQVPYQPGHAQPPNSPHWATPQSGPPARPETPLHRKAWPYALLAVMLLMIGGSAAFAYDRGLILKDSGVAACEAMRDGNKVPGAGEAKGFTEAEYREVRETFADSRYEDIREHGTKLMDVAWQVSQLGDGGEVGMEAWVYMQPLTTHMSGLQSACADQGIIIDLKAGN